MSIQLESGLLKMASCFGRMTKHSRQRINSTPSWLHYDSFAVLGFGKCDLGPSVGSNQIRALGKFTPIVTGPSILMGEDKLFPSDSRTNRAILRAPIQ